MLKKAMLAALALGALSGSVLAQDVSVDYDKAANFAAVKTFSLKIGTSWGNPLSEKRVSDEIAGALTAKGWAQAAEGSSDAAVVLHGATQTKRDLNTFYSGGGWGYRWGGGSAHTSVSEYTVGTLVVDIFNAKSKALMFRGTATDELSDKPEKNQKKVAKASDKMFKDFPPGSAKK
jgi:hypothetical protein